MRPVLFALVVAPFGWLAGASAIFCYGTGKMDLYRFPFLQWVEAAPWWRLSGWITLWVCVSAAIPSLALLAVIALMVRFGRTAALRRQRVRPVYGETGWATKPEMNAGSIATSRRPF